MPYEDMHKLILTMVILGIILALVTSSGSASR